MLTNFSAEGVFQQALVLASDMNETSAAIKSLHKAISIDSNFVRAFVLLAQIQQEDKRASLMSFVKALEINPIHHEAIAFSAQLVQSLGAGDLSFLYYKSLISSFCY